MIRFELGEQRFAKLEPMIGEDGKQYGWQMSSRDFAALQPLPSAFTREEETGELMYQGQPVNVYAS